MVTKVLKLTLLNHLFYYTEVSGGSTSAAVTGDFLGDLALSYAFNNALGRRDYTFKKKPSYTDVKDFGFYCTVAKPVIKHDKTEAYIQNTLFNVDGYVDVKAIEKSGKSPFKNFRQVQGMVVGAEFEALFIAKNDMELPPVIRMGRALETMVRVEEVASSKEREFWLNAYSLKAVFNNLDAVTNILVEGDKVNFSFILENYNLIKQLNEQEVISAFKPTFEDG